MERKIGEIKQISSDCKEIVEIVKNPINTSASPLTAKIREGGINYDK